MLEWVYVGVGVCWGGCIAARNVTFLSMSVLIIFLIVQAIKMLVQGFCSWIDHFLMIYHQAGLLFWHNRCFLK